MTEYVCDVHIEMYDTVKVEAPNEEEAKKKATEIMEAEYPNGDVTFVEVYKK